MHNIEPHVDVYSDAFLARRVPISAGQVQELRDRGVLQFGPFQLIWSWVWPLLWYGDAGNAEIEVRLLLSLPSDIPIDSPPRWRGHPHDGDGVRRALYLHPIDGAENLVQLDRARIARALDLPLWGVTTYRADWLSTFYGGRFGWPYPYGATNEDSWFEGALYIYTDIVVEPRTQYQMSLAYRFHQRGRQLHLLDGDDFGRASASAVLSTTGTEYSITRTALPALLPPPPKPPTTEKTP